MNMTKRPVYILIAVILFVALCSATVLGETDADAQSDAAVANPAYSDKAYAAVMEAFNAYDARSETAPNLDVSAAILMDADSGRVLYELCPDEPRYPASMTKLMTLLVTIDAIDAGAVSYDDVVTFSAAAVAEEGSKTGCAAGTTDTLKHVLEMMMVCSANDAAYAVAETVSGDVAAFAALMNAKAKELAMEHTNFVNPNGLHAENHFMTARDMALLCRHVIRNETVLYFCSLASTTLPTGTVCYNTNKLLFWYEGCDGFKTGTTEAAGHCLAATAKRDGMRLIAVVMGGTYDFSHYINSMKLLEYGFANYTLTPLVEKGSVLAAADVIYARETTVELVAEKDILYPLKDGETVTPEIVADSAAAIEGPAAAGLIAGGVVVKIDGREVGSCDLVTETTIHKRTIFHWLKDFFSALVSSV